MPILNGIILTPRRSLSPDTFLANFHDNILSKISEASARPQSQALETQHIPPIASKKQATESQVPTLDTTAIPNPIPDSGFHQTLAQIPGYPFATPSESRAGTLLYTFGTTSIVSASSFTIPFSTPPASMPPTSILYSSTTAFISGFSSNEAATSAVHTISKRTLPNTVIALLAVVAGCTLLGIFIVIKLCTRPKHRPRLTPSLPILGDDFPGDDLESKESPIFGGKERLSELGDPCFNTQYSLPTSAVSQPAKVAHGTCMRLARPQEKAPYSDSINCPSYPFVGYGKAMVSPLQRRSSTVNHPPYQQVQNAISHTMKRLSTVSLSLYPGTPRSIPQVGVAISGYDTPFTGDGYSVLARSRSRDMRNKDRQSQGLAYNDTDVYSPNVADDKQIASVQRATQGGRMRVKSSYYGPGIHSRISIRQNPVSKAGSTPLDTASQPCGPHIEQDNQALTEALGLASPLSDREILSPQSTVYPDDSLSIIDNERPCVNLGSCQAPMQYNTQASSLTPGASTKIGTLLMMDYGMDKDQNESNSRGQMAPSQRYSYDDDMLAVPSFGRGRNRTNDKPPRVPSPPRLPSLAQMAMEHANKEAYDNYRSVTYSIYGLYGESGKRYSVMYK